MAKKRVSLAAQPSWQWMEIPRVDATLCTGCETCCVVCPTDCLAMAQHLPWLARPDHCVSCGVCAAICPASAIHMAIIEE